MLEISVIRTSHITDNGWILSLTDHCPEHLEQFLLRAVKSASDSWMPEPSSKTLTPSRRTIFFVDENITKQEGMRFVMKKKQVKHLSQKDPINYDVQYERLLALFTTYPYHEIRTSEKLAQVVLEFNKQNLAQIVIDGISYHPKFAVQNCYGSLTTQGRNKKRFGIFEYVPGVSPRIVTFESHDGFQSGWNAVTETERLLFGRIHSLLCELANMSIQSPYFLEPWDLGVHQVIYSLDEMTKTINITILDTEEYLDSTKFGNFWPEIFEHVGLPAVLMFAEKEYSQWD